MGQRAYLSSMEFHGGAGLKIVRLAGRRAWAALLAAAILLPVPGSAADGRAAASRTGPPVVVELFTAQGCSSCPQANQMLGRIAEQERPLVLTFSVDYWDYLGWRDTFAKPEFTARQRAYVSRLKLKEIYTPAVVVGGRREAPAVDQDEVEALIEAEAKARRNGPSVRFLYGGDFVRVGEGARPARGGEVWLVRYDPGPREVRVRDGENAGRTVSAYNVVRELERLGAWRGRMRTYTVPKPSNPQLRTIVLVQGAEGGPILAAAVRR